MYIILLPKKFRIIWYVVRLQLCYHKEEFELLHVHVCTKSSTIQLPPQELVSCPLINLILL